MEIFLIGFLIGVGWWLNKRHAEREKAKYKTCPHCAETILSGARVCKHCQRDLMPLANAEAKTTPRRADDRPHHLGHER